MTAPATLLERLERALAELDGLTPDGIADRMRALGIKGKQKDDCLCPIAEYLKRAGLPSVHVGTFLITADINDAGDVGTDTPDAVEEFIERFDRGVYLDLVQLDGGTADG